MIAKLVRIKCRPRDRSESQKYEIMLEAIVDGDKLRAMPWMGTANFQGMYPFIMDVRGRIDFGSGFEGTDRFWKTTIFGKPIRSGEIFSISGITGSECTYEIYDVQPLLRSDLDTETFGVFDCGDGDEPD